MRFYTAIHFKNIDVEIFTCQHRPFTDSTLILDLHSQYSHKTDGSYSNCKTFTAHRKLDKNIMNSLDRVSWTLMELMC